MILSNKPYEKWTEEDIKQICKDKIAEDQRLDFKRELKLEPLKERFELLKDITSFANAQGGIIIYGIETEKTEEFGEIAKNHCPNSDASLIDSANRIIYSSVSPKIDVKLHQIPASSGGFYIIAYVAQSYLKPHSFNWKRETRWYIRRNQDNFPLTEIEIREMYFQSYQIKQNIKQRYNELDLDIGVPSSITIISMPLIPELSLINTLTQDSNYFLPKLHYDMYATGDGNYLQPRIDRFEKVVNRIEKIIITRLFQHGEFMISYGFPINNIEIISVNIRDIYLQISNSIQYFYGLYSKLEYFGDVRLWFEINNLNNDNIRISHPGRTSEHKFLRKHILIWKDIKLDQPIEFDKISNDFTNYLMQGCGIMDW